MMVKKIAITWLATGLAFIWVSAQGSIPPVREDPAAPLLKPDDRSVPEKSEAGPYRDPSVGVREVPRPDGGRDIIYFSITPEPDRQARKQAEKNKIEKSLDWPRNIILFGH